MTVSLLAGCKQGDGGNGSDSQDIGTATTTPGSDTTAASADKGQLIDVAKYILIRP